MKKLVLILALTFGLLACSPGSGTPTTPTTTSTSSTSTSTSTTSTTTTTVVEPTVHLDEQFDTLNLNRWKPYHSTYGDGNNELQCHTPNNVTATNGQLVITAQRETYRCPTGTNLNREWTSGFIGSRDTGTYYPLEARYEMRAKLPHGQGLWPAFWLRHANGGAGNAEVDIMEYFHAEQPGQVRQSLHLRDGRLTNRLKVASFFETPTNTPEWHIYAVEIEQVTVGIEFRFYIDNTLTGSYIDTNPVWDTADPAHSWDIAINLSVGGDWIGHPDDPLGYLQGVDRCAQGGTVPDNCVRNGIMRWDGTSISYVVDYVRVISLTTV